MNIERIERAILAEDFFPQISQYDDIYYKNLLRQKLYDIYKCACNTNKDIEQIKIQSTPPPTPPINLDELEKKVIQLLNYYNSLVQIYVEIHNEKLEFENKIKILAPGKLSENLDKQEFKPFIYVKPNTNEYEQMKSLFALNIILMDRINKIEQIINKYLNSNIDFEKILPKIFTGGNSFTEVDEKLKEIKDSINNINFDLKNLLKFKSQIRVSEDQYLNMIKSMKVKLEKDAMDNAMDNPNKVYNIVMNDKELINLGDDLKLDNLPFDDEIIEDIRTQISESQNIGTFQRPQIFDFDFNKYNQYKDQLQDVYVNLNKISDELNKKIEDKININIKLTFIKKLNYNEKKKEYNDKLKAHPDVKSYAKFVLDKQDLTNLSDDDLNKLRTDAKQQKFNPNKYDKDKSITMNKYYEKLKAKQPIDELLEKFKRAYKLLITDYDSNIDNLRKNIDIDTIKIDKPYSDLTIQELETKQKEILDKEKTFVEEIKKYIQQPKISGGSKTDIQKLETSLKNITELIEFTNKLKMVVYTFEIIKNISTNINKTISIIQEKIYDYLNLLIKYNKVLHLIIINKIDINDFYFLSEIEEAKNKIINISDTVDNKLYKKLAINICNYFIKELSKGDNSAIIIDESNYMYFYLIFFVSDI